MTNLRKLTKLSTIKPDMAAKLARERLYHQDAAIANVARADAIEAELKKHGYRVKGTVLEYNGKVVDIGRG